MLFPLPSIRSTSRRVVVTGAGIVTALGIGWKTNEDGFRLGRTGFRSVTRFDVSKQRARVAAEIDLPNTTGVARTSNRGSNRLDYSARLLLTAAREAWQQSGWTPSDQLPMVFGTTAAGMSLGQDFLRQVLESPSNHRRQPARVAQYQAQVQARSVASALGCNGPITIISNACATGSNAIGHAWEIIRSGQADQALAGGYEALCQTLFAGFDSLQALSTTTCRPFDAHRDGLALGEGAAVLALETSESASHRGAEILGEVVGYGTVIDLHHLTQPHPEGEAAFKSMRLACDSAGLNPDDIDYINAHGTGTPLNDSSEAAAIARWGGERARSLPVSSTKASIGHTLGAAGAIEAAICLMALRSGFLPPELSLQTPDPACVFPIVREPMESPLRYALSNSFGFGGVNASLIFGRRP